MVFGRPALSSLIAASGALALAADAASAQRLFLPAGWSHVSGSPGASGFTGNGRLHVGAARPERAPVRIEYSPPLQCPHWMDKCLPCGHLSSCGCGCFGSGIGWPGTSLGFVFRDDYGCPLAGVPAPLPDVALDPNLGLGGPPVEMPPAPPSASELLAARDYAAAARALERVVAAEEGNMFAARLLAVALLGAGQAERAAGTLMVALDNAPQLAAIPVDASGFAPGELRRLTLLAVQRGGADDSAAFWTLAAVLMQAEGRLDGSGRAIDRAKEAGLSGPVLEAFRAALPPASVAARP